MITAKEAMSLERAQLSVEDEASCLKLEDIFDGAVANVFDGTAIMLQIPLAEHSERVISTFVARCSAAGWIIQSRPITGESKIVGRQQQPNIVAIRLDIAPSNEARKTPSAFPPARG